MMDYSEFIFAEPEKLVELLKFKDTQNLIVPILVNILNEITELRDQVRDLNIKLSE